MTWALSWQEPQAEITEINEWENSYNSYKK